VGWDDGEVIDVGWDDGEVIDVGWDDGEFIAGERGTDRR
jgi:hypothetical protein